jgi:hypothetical protein
VYRRSAIGATSACKRYVTANRVHRHVVWTVSTACLRKYVQLLPRSRRNVAWRVIFMLAPRSEASGVIVGHG